MMSVTKQRQIILAASMVFVLMVSLMFVLTAEDAHPQNNAPSIDNPPPVLAVTMVQVHEEQFPVRVPATGHIHAWQEASISAEADGLKLVDVKVNVGDRVKSGQLLARFNSDIVEAELAESIASVAQAIAAAEEAELNFNRAKTLVISNAISTQQLDQMRIASMTTRAQLDAARAIEKKNRLRLKQTQVLAPNNGVITSRTATIGTVVPSAQELFRLIENGRLEWRAIIATSDIGQLAIGQNAVLLSSNYTNNSHTHDNQTIIQGTLRMLAPTIDTSTHNALAYVDVPSNTHLRVGTFIRGYIEVGDAVALTLPYSAIMLRDGFHYVMQVNDQSIVSVKKITIGRKIDNRIEIRSGLSPSESVIASGLSFLSEGDRVNVVVEGR